MSSTFRRRLLAAVFLVVAAGSVAISWPFIGARQPDYNDSMNQAVKRLLPNADSRTGYRVGGAEDLGMEWINARSSVPETRGYQAEGVLHPDWQYWLDVTLKEPQASDAERAFLLDWYSVKWMYAGPHPNEFPAFDRRPDLYKPLGSDPASPMRTYEFRDAAPILTSRRTPSALVIGSDGAYETVLRALAAGNVNSHEVIPVRGGRYVDGHSLDELKRFDVIVVYEAAVHDNSSASRLLSHYVASGGGLFVEASGGGDPFLAGGRDPLPINSASVAVLPGAWNFRTLGTNFTNGVPLSSFSPPVFGDSGRWEVESAVLKRGSRAEITAGGDLVMASRDFGRGRVVWSGMNLPYHIAANHSAVESRFLGQVLQTTANAEPAAATVDGTHAEYVNGELNRIAIAPGSNGVLMKASVSEEWHASIGGHAASIYRAGPDMMYVPVPRGTPPETTVTLSYRPSKVERLGDIVSVLVLALLLAVALGIPPTRALERRLLRLVTDTRGTSCSQVAWPRLTRKSGILSDLTYSGISANLSENGG
jgi:hypothetical protein